MQASNKQQASEQQHFSNPFHEFLCESGLKSGGSNQGPPHTCPFQIPGMSRDLVACDTGKGGGGELGVNHAELAQFQPFLAKIGQDGPWQTVVTTPNWFAFLLAGKVVSSSNSGKNLRIAPRIRPQCCLVAKSSSANRDPKTKIELYLGLHGFKSNSEATQPTCNPPLFVVSTPQNGLNGQLHPRTSADLAAASQHPEPTWPAAGPIFLWPK